MILPFDSGAWDWGGAEHRPVTFAGRSCVAASGHAIVLADAELLDGTIELELAVGGARAFHGVVWRARDGENYESFFVRPHQVGNPDAVQYTPVFNDVSCWQLYHGDGFWAPLAFPHEEWFRIRVAFAGDRAEMYVADLDEPALLCTLRAERAPGRVGILVGGDELYLTELSCDEEAAFRAPPPAATQGPPGVIRAWQVSDAFPEHELEHALGEERSWTAVECEPSGLVNLARVQGIRDGRNTVLARTTIRVPEACEQLLELGFSDRAVVYLDGRPLFRGADAYRSRDYRFLGSIGWFDALHLTLAQGDNELTVAVSEDFGGWGVQARLVPGRS